MCPAKEVKVSSSIAPFNPQRTPGLLEYTQLPGERMRRAKNKRTTTTMPMMETNEEKERKAKKEREKDAKESAS